MISLFFIRPKHAEIVVKKKNKNAKCTLFAIGSFVLKQKLCTWVGSSPNTSTFQTINLTKIKQSDLSFILHVQPPRVSVISPSPSHEHILQCQGSKSFHGA